MITYRATLDVARPIGQFPAQLLADERAARGTRRGRCALPVWAQAVLVLRWFRDATPVARLAADARNRIATAYRYLHEGITVLAAQAPDLHEVLDQRLAAGDTQSGSPGRGGTSRPIRSAEVPAGTAGRRRLAGKLPSALPAPW